MLRSMTYAQLREWMAYDALEPFGEIREDHRAAYIVATLVNLKKKRGSKLLTSFDVLQRFGDQIAEKPAKSWQHMKALAKMASAFYNREEEKKAEKEKKQRPRRVR